jgi:biofilm PGA synthesis protein PgaD
MWLLYLYLMRTAFVDLYYIVKDLAVWAWSGDERPFLPAMFRFLDTLADYGIVIVANGTILILWAVYNWLRFRGPDRRGGGKPVTAADLAALYGRPAGDIEGWQQARILVMFHDPDGTLVGVDTKGEGPASVIPLGTTELAEQPSG